MSLGVVRVVRELHRELRLRPSELAGVEEDESEIVVSDGLRWVFGERALEIAPGFVQLLFTIFDGSAIQVGGTNAVGTFTASALSATGVTFTFSLTPTAASTEIVSITCVVPGGGGQ